MSKSISASAIPFQQPIDRGVGVSTRDFVRVDEGRYLFTLGEVGIEFEIDRLRRERNDLVGELAVRCDLAGAKTIGESNTLSLVDFNMSSQRSRQERAKLLADRSQASEVDWLGLVEDFCQRVTLAEREGQPAVVLRNVSPPPPDEDFDIDGVRLWKREPVILFGAGGGAKSYTALYYAGTLAARGERVLYADWECSQEDHRQRLGRLFGDDMPDGVLYARCDRPLVDEADRLRRIVKQHRVTYAVFDSVAYASDGPAEAQETAARYFRAVRQIGIGSLHLAHVTKAEQGDQFPFGTIFWNNTARATWFLKRSDGTSSTNCNIGLFNRKTNGAPLPPVGYTIEFSRVRTTYTPVDVSDVHELAAGLKLKDRMRTMLKRGAKTYHEIATELEANLESVEKAARRGKGNLFTLVLGADGVTRVGLVERRNGAQ